MPRSSRTATRPATGSRADAAYVTEPSNASALPGDDLRDLDGVERGALAQVVVAHEKRKAAPTIDARVEPQPADVARVATGGVQRRGHLGDLDARRVRQELECALHRQRAAELRVDRQ